MRGVSVGAVAAQPLVPGSPTGTNHATHEGATAAKKASLPALTVVAYTVDSSPEG